MEGLTEDNRIAIENTRQARRRSLRIYQSPEIANRPDFEKYECNKKSRRKKVNAMNSTIIENIQEIISTTKKQRSKTALTVMNVLTTSISSETISKKHVSRNLELNNKRLSRGRQPRTSLLKSDNASWNFTKRKTRSDAISDEKKKTRV